MSDSSSHSTQPSESDFHDSHPLNNDTKKHSAPPIGDLSTVETSIETPLSDIHSVGDMSGIEASPESDVLGDISLLDEAFAEMDESAAQQNTDIPVLNDSIETPSESRIISPETTSASVPLLNQEATVFAEMLKPASNSAPASQVSDSQMLDDAAPGDNSASSLFDAADDEDNSNIAEMNSSLEIAAALLSEASPTTIQPDATDDAPKIAAASEITGDDALAALLDEEPSAAVTEEPTEEPDTEKGKEESAEPNAEESLEKSADSSHSTESQIEHSDSDATSIDEKIAVAHSELIDADSDNGNESEIDINEIPLATMSSGIDSSMEVGVSDHSEFSASFAEHLVSNPLNTEVDTEAKTHASTTGAEAETITTKSSEFDGTQISEFNPDVDLNSNAIAQSQATHSVGIIGQGTDADTDAEQNNLNLSIPFELHSQLSSKIDELVIQATSSITEELHLQLSTRLENLLANSVESVLPKLVNQMATELRTDINGRIKQQLPNIINDVLNKTRLQK